jgi:UDP-N-acetylglucosamine 1-carboxyvinyltransferase
MDKLHIKGGKVLQGVVPISGAKNAALPAMAACLLTEGTLFLENIPSLVDVRAMCALLEALGVTCHTDLHVHRLSLSASSVKSVTAPYDLVRKMRASILALGPLVARHGTAKVSLPGGCAIGVRPIDLHLKGLEALGASILQINCWSFLLLMSTIKTIKIKVILTLFFQREPTSVFLHKNAART